MASDRADVSRGQPTDRMHVASSIYIDYIDPCAGWQAGNRDAVPSPAYLLEP